jgi:RNA polymerase sigma factor (sigma-70 family)
MGKKLDFITSELQEFIESQKIFFVGTAGYDGRVNVSPKGMDSFRVIGKNKIVWMNLTGSGNETAAHLLKNNRMTIMFCAFEGKPMILRLYGEAKIYHKRDSKFEDYSDLFPENPGARQIIEMEVDLVQTSCGFAVPFMDFREEYFFKILWGHFYRTHPLNNRKPNNHITFMVNKPQKTELSSVISLRHSESTKIFEKKSDLEVWNAFDKGDEMAFNYIYRCFTPIMFSFGIQITKDVDLVKDCMQNLFIDLRRKRGSLSDVISIKSYLLKILQRELFRAIKKESSHSIQNTELPENAFLIEVSHETKVIQLESETEINTQLKKALNQLTARQRQALVLLYEEGMSYKEIAEVLEFNEVKSARKLVYRAIESLKQLLKN